MAMTWASDGRRVQAYKVRLHEGGKPVQRITCINDLFSLLSQKLMWFASISLQHGCHKQRFLKFPDFSPDKCKFSLTNHKLVLEMDSNLSSQPFLYSFSHVKSCSWYMNIDSSSTICAIKDWLSWKPNIRFVIQFHEQYFYWCNMIHVHKMYKRILGVTKQ